MPSQRASPSLSAQSRKRKHSEISGLNIDEPVTSRIRYSAEEEETNLWTTVKSYLEDPAGRPQPSVSCPVCMYPIAIRGIPILEPCPWKLASGSQKFGVVLLCAHIICGECYNGYIRAQNALDPHGQRRCPLCRADLKFPGCMSIVPPQRLPVATDEDSSIVPLTLPELQPGFEYRFPQECRECVELSCEEYINVSLRFCSEMIHGVGYYPGEGSQEWDDVVEASQERLWDYLARQRAMPSFRNGSVPTGLLRVSFIGEPAHIPSIAHTEIDSILYSQEGEAFWCVPVHRECPY